MIDISELESKIVERLKPLDPEKIILFGSYASGNPREDSDIDLYVVTKDDFIPETWKEKNNIYLEVANRLQDILQEHPTDLITHTKKMHEKFVEMNSSFAKDIMENGVVIYE